MVVGQVGETGSVGQRNTARCRGKRSIDDPVLKFFKEEAPAEPSENLEAMRVRDLLTMSCGHDVEPTFGPEAPPANPVEQEKLRQAAARLVAHPATK